MTSPVIVTANRHGLIRLCSPVVRTTGAFGEIGVVNGVMQSGMLVISWMIELGPTGISEYSSSDPDLSLVLSGPYGDTGRYHAARYLMNIVGRLVTVKEIGIVHLASIGAPMTDKQIEDLKIMLEGHA